MSLFNAKEERQIEVTNLVGDGEVKKYQGRPRYSIGRGTGTINNAAVTVVELLTVAQSDNLYDSGIEFSISFTYEPNLLNPLIATVYFYDQNIVEESVNNFGLVTWNTVYNFAPSPAPGTTGWRVHFANTQDDTEEPSVKIKGRIRFWDIDGTNKLACGFAETAAVYTDDGASFVQTTATYCAHTSTIAEIHIQFNDQSLGGTYNYQVWSL